MCRFREGPKEIALIRASVFEAYFFEQQDKRGFQSMF
jgi:hypothetical protein